MTFFKKGVKINIDNPSEEGLPPPPMMDQKILEFIVEIAKKNNKPVFFLSFTDEGMQMAANAGCNVHLG